MKLKQTGAIKEVFYTNWKRLRGLYWERLVVIKDSGVTC